MELNQRTIDRLEKMFAKDCQIAIEILAYQGMSEEQYSQFEDCLKVFSQYDDLREFISETLVDKGKEVARLYRRVQPKEEDMKNILSFRRLAKIITKFCDQESIGIFSSFLLTDKLPTHFFIFLEEMIAKGLDTTEAQKIFESLISTHSYDLNLINKYLSIIKQDAYGLTKNLVQRSHYAGMVRYIRELNTNKDSGRLTLLSEQIVPSLLENYTGDRTHYLGILMSIISGGTDFIKELTHDSKHIGDCEEFFGKYLIANHFHDMVVIKNLMAYLEANNPKLVPIMEEKCLGDTRPYLLIQYASEVPTSNKRKVLVRLVELKDEGFLVEFIKKFPAYSSLMPML